MWRTRLLLVSRVEPENYHRATGEATISGVSRDLVVLTPNIRFGLMTSNSVSRGVKSVRCGSRQKPDKHFPV